MKLIIAGSRSITAHKILSLGFVSSPYTLSGLTEIISGTAKGADRLGELLAAQFEIQLVKFPADWNRYGKSAGYKRNAEMADYADAALILWDGVSKGSKHMEDIMKRIGKPVYVYTSKGEIL